MNNKKLRFIHSLDDFKEPDSFNIKFRRNDIKETPLILFPDIKEKISLNPPPTNLYKSIFKDDFYNLFKTAKHYMENKKERESLLFSRLCLEYILRSMFVLHVKKGDITFKELKEGLGESALKTIVEKNKKKLTKTKENICSFCNILSVNHLTSIIYHIGKLGNKSDGTESIHGWVSDIAEYSNEGVHLNIDSKNCDFLKIKTQSKAVYLFLESLVEKLKEI